MLGRVSLLRRLLQALLHLQDHLPHLLLGRLHLPDLAWRVVLLVAVVVAVVLVEEVYSLRFNRERR